MRLVLPMAATKAWASCSLRLTRSPRPWGRILGNDMADTHHAGGMISEVALAINIGVDTVDISKAIHPHPTLGGKHRHGGGDRSRLMYRCAIRAEVSSEMFHKKQQEGCFF